MKVLIFGSRYFDDPEFLKEWLYYLLKDKTISEVVTGGQRSWHKDEHRYYGADYFAEVWAKERSIPLKIFKADWNKYGISAGPIRNKEMSLYLSPVQDLAIGFWDGKSTGTAGMAKLSQERKIETVVIEYLNPEFSLPSLPRHIS